MRITDCCSAKPQFFATNGDRFIDDFSRRPSNRYLVTVKTDFPHVDLDGFLTLEYPTLNLSACRHNGERTFLDQSFIPEIAGKYSKPVTALFSFAAVWIK